MREYLLSYHCVYQWLSTLLATAIVVQVFRISWSMADIETLLALYLLSPSSVGLCHSYMFMIFNEHFVWDVWNLRGNAKITSDKYWLVANL